MIEPQSNTTRIRPAYKLSPTGFEHEVALVFASLCKVNGRSIHPEVVGGSGDDGIDIKLWDDSETLVGIVQAKRYHHKSTLPPTTIRDLDSVRRRYGVRSAYLVTTAKVSQKSRNLALECRIKLIDGTEFEDMRTRAYKLGLNADSTVEMGYNYTIKSPQKRGKKYSCLELAFVTVSLFICMCVGLGLMSTAVPPKFVLPATSTADRAAFVEGNTTVTTPTKKPVPRSTITPKLKSPTKKK